MSKPEDEKKFTILVGSVRSAKTWAVSAKIIVHLCRYEVEGRRVICGKSKKTVYKNVLIDLFEIVGKDNYSYNQTSGELWLFGTQWFVMGAHDASSWTDLLGMTIGIFVGDEIIEYPENFMKQIPLRMSPTGSRFYGTSNPGNPNHFLKTDIIDDKDWQKDLTVLTFTLDDNPNIDADEKERIKRSQKGVFFLRFILGKWVAAQGAIYKDCWSDDLLYSADEIGGRLYGWGGYVDNLVFVDYGTANPLASYEAIDDGHTLWIDREYWWDSAKEMVQKTDAQYADDLVKWIGPEGWRNPAGVLSISRVTKRAIPRFVLDPSAASFRNELQGRGIWVIDANNDVLDGIRKVSSVMASRRLRINRECVNLIRELPAYMWNDKKTKIGEEEPVKENDHGCDAIRYGIEECFSDWRLLQAA